MIICLQINTMHFFDINTGIMRQAEMITMTQKLSTPEVKPAEVVS